MNKIKIAQVIGIAANGGIESLWLNYFRYIDKTKFEFDFLVENESKLINREQIEAMGGRVVIIPSYKKPIKYIKELTKIFKNNKYDIVHSNMNTLSVFTLKAAKKAGVAIRIAHSHSTSNRREWKKNILKNILRPLSKKYSTHYFTCSELAGRYLFGHKTYERGKVVIINNAIELDKFKMNNEYRVDIRNMYNISESTIVLGNVGRIGSQKNQGFLIDVFNQYKKINNNSKLLILGDGPLLNDLKEKVKNINIEKDVIFAGVHSDVFKFYSAMDVFCMPSLYEGLPVVGIEAQANGLPVIFSDTITNEVCVNENCKFLSLKNEPHKWSLCVNELIQMGRNNKFQSEIYDIVFQTKRLEEIYIKIVNEKCDFKKYVK